jgi:hypothetical protein
MAFYLSLYFRGGTRTSELWSPRGDKLGPSGWRCMSVLSRELHHAASNSSSLTTDVAPDPSLYLL